MVLPMIPETGPLPKVCPTPTMQSQQPVREGMMAGGLVAIHLFVLAEGQREGSWLAGFR